MYSALYLWRGGESNPSCMHPHVGHLLLTARALVICYLCCALSSKNQMSSVEVIFVEGNSVDWFRNPHNDTVRHKTFTSAQLFNGIYRISE